MRTKLWTAAGAVLALVVLALVGLVNLADDDPTTEATAPTTTVTNAVPTSAPSSTGPEASSPEASSSEAESPETSSPDTVAPTTTVDAQFTDLAPVALDELPPEALDTLRLIRDGGPYPYRQDDSVFENREGILPVAPYGTYREYTVDTPGSPDRGARRLVVDDRGPIFYTDDHYDSFREVVP